MKLEITAQKATGEKIEAEIIFLSNLTQEIEGKIIVIDKLDRVAVMKLLALDASGVITSQIAEELFEDLIKGKNWGIGESCCLKLPLLVVSENDFLKLKDYQGKKAVLNPQEKSLTI